MENNYLYRASVKFYCTGWHRLNKETPCENNASEWPDENGEAFCSKCRDELNKELDRTVKETIVKRKLWAATPNIKKF